MSRKARKKNNTEQVLNVIGKPSAADFKPDLLEVNNVFITEFNISLSFT